MRTLTEVMNVPHVNNSTGCLCHWETCCCFQTNNFAVISFFASSCFELFDGARWGAFLWSVFFWFTLLVHLKWAFLNPWFDNYIHDRHLLPLYSLTRVTVEHIKLLSIRRTSAALTKYTHCHIFEWEKTVFVINPAYIYLHSPRFHRTQWKLRVSSSYRLPRHSGSTCSSRGQTCSTRL